ncbi:MAG: rhodanese-like domain-containing protein [Prolixibacteraceae bacterium]
MYRIPETYKEELKEYRKLVNDASANNIDPVQFKIFRVTHGIYEQRKKGTFMVRIRCAGGAISSSQLYKVSRLAGRYGSKFLHITTRQEIQLHNVGLSDTPDILDQLYETGLSTRGGGGNTVRNITSPVDSGISSDEIFDVTPYNIALTNLLINHEKSFTLPRKLKIAFSGSEKDTALAAFNDIGFIAKIKNGEKGFKVFLGGSPSVRPMVGEVLFEFLPAGKIFGVALAAIEMFHQYGNRKNRHKARLRYLFYKYGKNKVFQFFAEIYNQYKNEQFGEVNEPLYQNQPAQNTGLEIIESIDIENWKKNYITPQKQEGLFTAEIPVMHGNLTNKQAEILADFAGNFGNNSIRFSRRQNIHLRNIPEIYLGTLYTLLAESAFEINKPRLLGNLVSCTGADTCQLGICFSKGSLQAIHDRLFENDWLNNLNNTTVNTSGCPNSCGQHLIADLGFAGRVSRNGRIYPSYNVFAGAVIGERNPLLPIKLGEIAAKDLPEFTNDMLFLYHQKSGKKTFREFIETEKKEIGILFDKYSKIPSFEEDKKYYIDWGNNDLFTLEARGSGECSAGLLDVIETEIKIIEKCKESFSGQQEIGEQTVLLHEIMLSASKLLCLSAQEKITDEHGAINIVKEQFIGKNRISRDYLQVLEPVTEGNFTKLLKSREMVIAYADTAVNYYRNLDDNLQQKFKVKEITAHELKAMLDEGSDICLIDVRETWEKEIADIGGQIIPFGTIEKKLEKIPRNRKTILYCRTGRRSSEAIIQIAKKRNPENLYNLKGGIHAWANDIDNTLQKY